MEWIQPKTDWAISDRFNISDYNRIKGNLTYLKEVVEKLYLPFHTDDMGPDKVYSDYLYASEINSFENNLESINNNTFSQDIGETKKYKENGSFIKYDELNRIEYATILIKEMLERQESGLSRLAFRLGNKKGVQC